MNPTTIGLVALRTAALVLTGQGKTKEAGYLKLVADAAEAGRNVDAHMAAVATALKTGAPKDWDGAIAGIEADSARLQSS